MSSEYIRYELTFADLSEKRQLAIHKGGIGWAEVDGESVRVPVFLLIERGTGEEVGVLWALDTDQEVMRQALSGQVGPKN